MSYISHVSCAGQSGNDRRQWAWSCWLRRVTTPPSSGCTEDPLTVGRTRGPWGRRPALPPAPRTSTTVRRPWLPLLSPRYRSPWRIVSTPEWQGRLTFRPQGSPLHLPPPTITLCHRDPPRQIHLTVHSLWMSKTTLLTHPMWKFNGQEVGRDGLQNLWTDLAITGSKHPASVRH